MPQFKDMTPEQRREAGRKGGLKSVEVRRRKKAMKEALNAFLELKMKSGEMSDLESLESYQSLKGANITVGEAIALSQIQKALKGDTTAAAFVRDTSGQKPKDEVDLSGAIPVVISGEGDIED